MGFSVLDAAGLAAPLPEGVAPGSDTGALTVGVLCGIDVPNSLVQVTIAGSDALWVPAVPAIYTQGGRVRLLRSPLDGGRASICLGPFDTPPTIVAGTVTAVNSGAGTVTVTTLGGTYTVPYVAGTYSVGTKVYVLRSPSRFGVPEIVLGPQGNFTAPDPTAPGGGTGNPGEATSKQVMIVPQWSGSWRASQSRWDTWNTDRYGGRSTLWQGNGVGSGAMTGLAVFGDQIVNLGAVAITKMTVNIYRADSSFSDARAAVVQPSPHGAQPPGAPTVSGATASSPGLTPNQGAQVDLPSSVFESFRTGASKGLATVGSTYAGFSGTPDRFPVHADGFALTIQYTVVQ